MFALNAKACWESFSCFLSFWLLGDYVFLKLRASLTVEDRKELISLKLVSTELISLKVFDCFICQLVLFKPFFSTKYTIQIKTLNDFGDHWMMIELEI